MASDTQILRTEQGVILKRVTLRDGSSTVAEGFVVTSRRTPEVPNFDDEASALVYFEAELKRSQP